MVRPQTFDADGVATAGLVVVRRNGWAGATVRSIAAELGVSPMALYRVASDAEKLRRLVADAAAAPIQPAAGEGDLERVLCSWALDAYAHLTRHPGLASWLIAHWTELPGWLDIVESLLAAAESEGLSGPEAVATVNAVFAYVLVRAQLHDAAKAAPRRQLEPLRREPARYPSLRREHAEFATAQTERHFRFGLDAIVAGLALGRGRPGLASGHDVDA